MGAAGSFLMSLMAAEPCPGSSPCPSSLPCSHHPANPEVSLSPPPLLDSLLPPAVSSLWVVPAASCTSGKCFSWFSQGAEIPSAAFLRSWVFSPGIYRCLTPSFPPFSPCFLGNPSEHPPNADCRTRLLGALPQALQLEQTRIAIPRRHFECSALLYPT